MKYSKIINDPVHGIITIPSGIILQLIEHPYFQRLRRIKQLGLSYLVYPGVTHTRFLHTLGAMHLAQSAVKTLRSKESCEITEEDEEGLYCAILLHDIGHAPLSHSLEYCIVEHLSHENISEHIISRLIEELQHPALNIALQIFTGKHPKRFLHQLLSSELDVDRLDYLRRDSFFSGVAEGMIGIERIIQMLTVHEGDLVIEEKGLYSIEKFLMSRRMMYWQVYLHKTVLAADFLLKNIFKRARYLLQHTKIELEISPTLHYFLSQDGSCMNTSELLDYYLQLDDGDIDTSIKLWSKHSDKVLSSLCLKLLNRDLPSIIIKNEPFNFLERDTIINSIIKKEAISLQDIEYFYSENTVQNNTYAPTGNEIHILTKENVKIGINSVSELIGNTKFRTISKKYYRIYPKQPHSIKSY